jgi:hypothetical protein
MRPVPKRAPKSGMGKFLFIYWTQADLGSVCLGCVPLVVVFCV